MEDLSETYPPKLLLAIFQKWNKDGHGARNEEEKYINYFKTKNLVMLSYTKEELIYDGLIESLNFVHHVRTQYMAPSDYKYEISPVIMYRYKNRDFCIKHNGVEKFQKLWRKFHYKIMPRYKNIRNLQYRSIYGKFKKQI
tara:strand:- start:5146 stop:5565 length:420 start_codon:yes stop_codon:yes gene_type:complete